MSDQTLAIAGVPMGGTPAQNLPDAFRAYATLGAVVEVATERRDALKAWITDGRAAGWERTIDGVGKALITKPSTKAVVVDRDAFEAWALEDPDVEADVRTDVDWSVLGSWVEAHPDEPLAEAVVELLDELPGARTTTTLLPEKLLGQILKGAKILDDGRVVNPETSEIIPGVEARQASTPSPRITPDPDLVLEVGAQIRSALGPVAIEKGGEA